MKQVIIFLLAVGLLSCNHQHNNKMLLQKRIDSLENELNSCQNSFHLLQSILWYQHSPEMRALYIQSYNNAKIALLSNLKNKIHKQKKNAVVVDIDETILDNSPYEGWLFLTNNIYCDSSWNEWVKEAKAEPLPGTVDFLNFAKNNGCEVFYISNRKKDPLFEPTLQNLKKFNLPFADEKHLLLKTKSDTNSAGKTTKEKRRLMIENELNFEIVLLCGDQIADFDNEFSVAKGITEKQINERVDKLSGKFGSRFIIIPNPMYSDWLSQNISGSDKNNKCTHLDSLRRSKIITR